MSRGKELLVGLVIIAATAVGVGGTLWLQGSDFGRTRVPVDVRLESVGQLAEGNVVTYRGVSIGRVFTVRVEPGGEAVRVRLMLDREITLPDDAAVVLGPESLFGAWQAEIVSRSSFPRFPFFEVGDSAQLPAAEVFVGEPEPLAVLGGYALPELSRLTASAEEISGNLAQLSQRLEIAFNQETADNMARAIGNIEEITRDLRDLVAEQSEVAEALSARADSALGEVYSAAVSARIAFEHVEGIISGGDVDSIVTNFSAASRDLHDVLQNLSSASGGLDGTMERADSAFARIDRITAALERGEGTVGRLLTDTAFAMRAESVLSQLDALLADFRDNPGKYIRLSIF